MPTPEMNLLVIRSADLDQAGAFYEKLGLSFTEEKHGNGPRHLSTYLGSLVLEIYPLGKHNPTSGISLGFIVDSLNQVISRLEVEHIVTPPRTTDFGYQATVQDSDAHVIDLTQRLF